MLFGNYITLEGTAQFEANGGDGGSPSGQKSGGGGGSGGLVKVFAESGLDMGSVSMASLDYGEGGSGTDPNENPGEDGGWGGSRFGDTGIEHPYPIATVGVEEAL